MSQVVTSMSMLRLCSLLPPFPFPLPLTSVDREAVIENSSYWCECTRFLTVPALQELAGLCVCVGGGGGGGIVCAQIGRRGESSLLALWKEGAILPSFLCELCHL